MTCFSHLLTDTVYVAEKTGIGTDAFAEPVFGSQRSERGAYEQSFRKIRDFEGNERTSSEQLVMEKRYSEDARFWLPGTDKTDVDQARIPIAIRNMSSRLSGGGTLFTVFF